MLTAQPRKALCLQKGVTLLELMIAVAILGIVVMVVVPGAQGILNQNRIVANVNEASGILQFARSQAIDEQTNTLVCPTVNFSNCTADWNNSKMVFMDVNGNGMRDDAEELLVSSSAGSAENYVTGTESSVEFLPNGGAQSETELFFCHKSKDNKLARSILVSLHGRVRTSHDDDNNGVHESPKGGALDCT